MATFEVRDGTGFRMNYDVVPRLLPETTLFIHGNMASNRWWWPAEDVLRRRAGHGERKGAMIRAEFRGFGQSSAPRVPDEVNMFTFARDYLSLLQSLDIGPVHVVGHSTGGLIAVLMMAMAPAAIRKAVLLDPVGATGVKFDETMIGAFETMKTDREFAATVMSSTIHGNDATSDFFRQVVVEDAFNSVKVVGHQVVKALDGLDVRKEAATIRSQTLVLHGEKDRILPLEDAKKLAATIPGATFEIIDGQGHSWNVEDPSGFVDRIEKFLF